MKRSLLAIAAASLSIAFLAGCSSAPSPAASAGEVFTEISVLGTTRVEPAVFADVISQPNVVIVDVRTPEEFAQGHIQGAVNIPVEMPNFAQATQALPPADAYAVYCRSGNRSQIAVEMMSQAGVLPIVELISGTNGWTAAGYPLAR